MKVQDAAIYYDRNQDPPVRVVELGVPGPRGYGNSSGATYTSWREDPSIVRSVLMLMIEFHTLTVREGIAPRAVHKAFLAIDEYRQIVAPDVEGAEEQGEALTRLT